jgi:hypothetical protein
MRCATGCRGGWEVMGETKADGWIVRVPGPSSSLEQRAEETLGTQ